MKTIYIAHAISGDLEGNIKKVLNIVRHLNITMPEILPFAPYIVDLQCLDDNIPKERERGLKNNAHYFNSGFIDELWIYGHITNGIWEEIELAKKANCLIRFCSS